MIWRRCVAGLQAVLLLAAAPASAQSVEQADRLAALARYGMAAAWCDRLGMTLTAGWADQLEQRMTAEAVSWGLAPEPARKAVAEAVTRASRTNAIDLDTIADKESRTEAGLRNLRSHFVAFGRTCLDAARDPALAGLIAVPAGFDLEAAATEAADSLLENGGLASWQTPTIQARGDLMMAAGSCRAQIGAVRSDAIFRRYSHASDARERQYYVHSFDEGLSDKSLNFDAAQCERLIKRLTAKAEAVR